MTKTSETEDRSTGDRVFSDIVTEDVLGWTRDVRTISAAPRPRLFIAEIINNNDTAVAVIT